MAKRCAAAEPRHGERWQRVAKAPANAHLPLDAILKKVVARPGQGAAALRIFLRVESSVELCILAQCLLRVWSGRFPVVCVP